MGAAAFTSIDSVASNYLLYLNFQFNDYYFRIIFCGCMRFQSCCLGSEYAKDMQLYYTRNAPKHNQQQKESMAKKEETLTNSSEQPSYSALEKIEEEDSQQTKMDTTIKNGMNLNKQHLIAIESNTVNQSEETNKDTITPQDDEDSEVP